MSDENKERRCKHCGKLLIDEKFFCRRCVLEGCNTAKKIVGSVGTVASAVSVATLLANNSNDNNDDIDNV